MNYQKISEEDFRMILTKPPGEILVYMLQVAEISRRNPDWAPVISFRDIPKEAPKTLVREFGWLFCGDGEAPRQNLRSEEDALKTLKSYVPFLDCLEWRGKYCLAGSSSVVACLLPREGYHKSMTPGDADFYPYYDPMLRKKMSDEENIMLSYQTFIDDMDELWHTDSEIGRYHPYMARSYTYRNRHCTTVALPNDDETNQLMAQSIPPPGYLDCCRSFQIIHRAHTSPVSVVVGFDQVCCKAFYDGDQIYFTLDAALALYFRINPIDWRRESPSHLRRAAKYDENYGFATIFPGLNFDLGRELANSGSYCWYYIARSRLSAKGVYSHHDRHNRDKTVIYLDFRIEDFAMHGVLNPLDMEGKNGWDEHQKYQESDYGSDITPMMALHYRCLSAAIKIKPDKMVVFAKRPASIVQYYDEVDVNFMLRKLITSEKSYFYMGTERGRVIAEQMARLTMRSDGRTCHLTLMGADAMKRFTELHGELTQIFEDRCKVLYPMVELASRHLSKVEFLMSNPGAQFTASFHPIIRSSAREYFGSRYVDVDITICKKAKLCCLWLWQNRLLFKGWDRNLVKHLFFWVDRAVIYGAMHIETRKTELESATKVNVFGVMVDPVLPQRSPDAHGGEENVGINPLPWKEPMPGTTSPKVIDPADLARDLTLSKTLMNNIGINQRARPDAVVAAANANIEGLLRNIGLDPTVNNQLPPQISPGLALLRHPPPPRPTFTEEASDSEDGSDEDTGGSED